MAKLMGSQLTALSGALLELYSPSPIADFPSRVLAILRRCFSFEFGAYHEISDYENERSVIDPYERINLEVLNAYLRQHPTWTGIVENRIASPVKISDFTSLSQWQRTDLYNGFFRPIGQNYQLAFITIDASPQLGIALNRSTSDFSEEERLMLDLLRPHLAQAFRASKLVSYLSEVAEGSDPGWLVVDQTGRIRFATPKAVRYIRTYFGEGYDTLLPSRARDWLRNRTAERFADKHISSPLKQFSIQLGPKRLFIESLSPVQASEQRLVLREVNEQPDAAPLRVLGLTGREAEVLLWVSQGKRNSEIATILGTSAKTITKHLERIFEKLSVETRTAAAAIALDYYRYNGATSVS